MGVFEGQFNHMTMATGINSEWPFLYVRGKKPISSHLNYVSYN